MEEIKLRILIAAEHLFLNYGIKSVTMDDLSRHLSMSKKTLYTVFPDKKSLVEETITHHNIKHKCFYEQFFNEKDNAIEDMLKVNFVISHSLNITKDRPRIEYELKKYYPDIFEKLDKALKDSMRKEVKRNIQKGKDEGLFRLDIDEEVIADLLLVQVQGIKHRSREKDSMEYNSYYNDQVFLYHLHGVVNEKGLTFTKEHYLRLKNELKETIKNTIPK